jgi:hypothetical protein
MSLPNKRREVGQRQAENQLLPPQINASSSSRKTRSNVCRDAGIGVDHAGDRLVEVGLGDMALVDEGLWRWR